MTFSRRWITVLVVLIGVLAWAGDVQAACTTSTLVDSRGRVVICTTCCSGGYCSTTCF